MASHDDGNAVDSQNVKIDVSDGSDVADLPSIDELRKMANHYFAEGDYDSALPLYSLAIDKARAEGDATAVDTAATVTVDRPVVIHLCNRSACLFKMERYEEARNDAAEAFKASRGRNAKASFRLARAQIALGQFAEALNTLDEALRFLKEEENSLVSTSSSGNVEELKKKKTNLEQQMHELVKLQHTARKKKVHQDKTSPADGRQQQPFIPEEIKSIKTESRKPSIREFEIQQELGVGNFSRVVVARHKITGEQFALKIIEKKQAANLAKRQHPNVYNEIQMERRTLLERLPGTCPRIIKMYHAFQDYNSLFYLMDLHVEGGDLWSQMKYRNKMVGCHHSLAKIWLWEIIDAMEHIHSHGIVHRDLKAENVLLSATGHVILIDFGTAKDLIETDLNGPEFVGTPDFMTPEAVKGTSGDDEVSDQKKRGAVGGDHTVDLWALGAVAFQLYTGQTPFASPSQYLTFLKILRGNLYRPLGISDDDVWDLIKKLLQVDRWKRLGADGFVLETPKSTANNGDSSTVHVMKRRGGYDVIRNHPYFHGLDLKSHSALTNETEIDRIHQLENEPMLIPSLRDLSIRACMELVRQDSLDFDLDTDHPPGDGSSHDMLRLSSTDRRRVMHLLDRLQLLREPRVYRRFFRKKHEARLHKIRVESRDYVGLTQMNDKQGQFPSEYMDGGTEIPVKREPVKFVYLTNPLFVQELNVGCVDESQRTEWTNKLKDSIRMINRTRPKVVVANGYIDDPCRKLLAKVNETIPVILNDGSTFFSFWICGAQGLVLRSQDFMYNCSKNCAAKDDDEVDVDKTDMSFDQVESGSAAKQLIWLREQLEQSRNARHHTFAFVDCDPRKLPESLTRQLARGRTLCTFGVIDDEKGFRAEYNYQVRKKMNDKSGGRNEPSEKPSEEPKVSDIDDASLASVDSDQFENAAHRMSIIGKRDSGLCYVTLEEYGVWHCEDT